MSLISRFFALFLASCCLAATPVVAETPDSASSAGAWLADYEQAWEKRDADAAAALFAEGAHYYETPYAEPFTGPDGVRAYWQKVTADQREVDFTWEIISEAPEATVAHWTARFDLASQDITVELDGVFVLRFDDQGRCTELREWWHAR